MNSKLIFSKLISCGFDKKRVEPHTVMVILAVCMALQMTSYILILPLFAQRFSELNAGAGSLATSSMAYAIAAAIAAPFMGGLADRFGRKPLVLIALISYFLVFIGYRFADSPITFILLRGAAGAFTAGLIPAVIGIVADYAPTEQRAKWIGIVNGGASIGWIVGPTLGGFLFDHWGFKVALLVSISIALATIVTVALLVPESRKQTISEKKSETNLKSFAALLRDFKDTLPQSLSAFGILLGICFAVLFAWSFIEPEFMFYAYDDLGWNSSMLGIAMSFYGIALTGGEFFLSNLSDRLGRKPVIVLGLVLFSAQFIGLAITRSYVLLAVSFAIAGLGNALYDPALSASILDVAPKSHQARVLGIKSAIGSLGNILGPGLAVVLLPSLSVTAIFLSAVVAVAFTTLAGMFIGANPKISVEIQSQKMADFEIN
jgi:MFS family permease